jgi:glycosyltransferase involved in cell wall biosynthesis
MMRALGELGHEVALTTLSDPRPEAIAGLRLGRASLIESSNARKGAARIDLSWPQERFRSYWGVDEGHIRFVREEAERFDADAVVVVGLEVLPYLAGVEGRQRVWYAADEWVWHHLSSMKLREVSSWKHWRQALIKGMYERAYASVIDRAWMVSDADRRALKFVASVAAVDVIPNGVDADHFRPQDCTQEASSCVFWGRLDFTPNVQALEWFCREVWPAVLRRTPQARFRILGAQPIPRVEKLAETTGVSISANLLDIRPEISGQQVVVLPFQSGGGIKNKLLEAASMAKPIICSKRACNGLSLPPTLPLRIAARPESWVNELLRLWSNSKERAELGNAARQWVMNDHTWIASARLAVSALQASMPTTDHCGNSRSSDRLQQAFTH